MIGILITTNKEKSESDLCNNLEVWNTMLKKYKNESKQGKN